MGRQLPITVMRLLRKLRYTLGELKYYILHRTVDKYHVVKTGLEPGYRDKDEIILHVNFNILKEYVECELAWMDYICTEDKKKIAAYRFDYWMTRIFFREFRAPELGLEHLDWEISLPGKDNKHQRMSAKKIKKLYLWWVHDRPQRKDIYDYQDLKESLALEDKYNKEDHDMLVKLMEVRRCLWT